MVEGNGFVSARSMHSRVKCAVVRLHRSKQNARSQLQVLSVIRETTRAGWRKSQVLLTIVVQS